MRRQITRSSSWCLLLGMLLTPGTRSASACESRLPDHLRVQDCGLAEAVTAAASRSPSLRGLIDRVGALGGIVYVTDPARADGIRAGLLGGLSHRVVPAAESVMLRIVMRSADPKVAIPTLAHELKHAIEVMEDPNARTEATVGALFGRIGWKVSEHTCETQAALDAGRAVARELADQVPASSR